jgi:hypothetical protein
MKTLIYQVYVGKSSKLYDHCTASVKAYAERIDSDYVLQTEPILKIKPNPFTTNRSPEATNRLGYLPIYEKENAFDYFNHGYDRIAIIDSDVYIRDTAPSIFETLDTGECFGAVVERDMPITDAYKRKIKNYSIMQYDPLAKRINFKPNSLGYEFMNMGVMIMDKSIVPYFRGKSAKEFLQRADFQPFIDGIGNWKWSTDQTLLNTWIRAEKMNYKSLHWQWNGLYSANTKIKECHFVHFFLKDKLPNRGENVKELMGSI